jgi:thiol-disulfide isomerase/thioredoxin
MFLMLRLSSNDSLNVNDFDQIKGKVDNKEDMLIYVYNDKSCEFCDDVSKVLNFYEEAYDLKFYKYNTDNNDASKLEKLFGFMDDYLVNPNVILVRDGKYVAVANQIMVDSTLREFLLQYNFINDNMKNKDYILGYEQFMNEYSSNDKKIILLINYGTSELELREKLLKLSEEYNFNYGIIYFGIGDSHKIVPIIKNNIGDAKFKTPLLIITQNNKIIDYIYPEGTQDMSKYLRKNNIIN